MKREIERKFDVPAEYDHRGLLFGLTYILKQKGYEVDQPEILTLRFTYYDTQSLEIHTMQGTLRLVEGFDSTFPASNRYDLKVGPLHERFEDELWSNEQLDINRVFRAERERLQVFGPLEEKAVAAMLNYQGIIRKDEFEAEYTLDYVIVMGAHSFTELEIELKKGRENELDELAGLVQRQFNLQPLTEQKYSRILRIKGLV